MNGIQFHETKAGRQLIDGTLPEIARQLAALVKAVERLAGSEGVAEGEGLSEVLYRPGDRVVLRSNPHHAEAVNVVGTVTEFRAGAGFAGCDLAYVCYQRPHHGTEHTMPFGLVHLGPGEPTVLRELADRYEALAADLRESAARGCG